MGRERVDIGFGEEPDALEGFDPSDWATQNQGRPRLETGQARRVAEVTGFRSREAATPAAPGTGGAGGVQPVQPAQPQPQSQSLPRRRRTGRNAQFNLKARPDTIASFCAVADAKGWGLGETLEHAVALLLREHGEG